MPIGDVASGCLEVIGRALLEIVVHGIGEFLWPWCQATGGYLAWLLTFGRVRLNERHQTIAGIIGLLFYLALIGLLIAWWQGGWSRRS